MVTSDDAARARLSTSDQIELLAALKAWRDQLPRVCLVASARVMRADVAPKTLYTVPAGHEAHLLVIHGEVGSDAGIMAVLDIGRPGAPATFVTGHSVHGAAGVGQMFPAARKLGQVSGADIDVTARYAETGAASTVGGPWTVTLFYSKAGS